MEGNAQTAQETLGARLGVRFLPMPETLDALLTPTGGLLVRAAGSLADLEARALLALAYFDVRR